MTETSTVLTDDAIRRQVLLEGVKGDIEKKFLPFLSAMRKEIAARLNEERDTERNRRRLNILKRDLRIIQQDIYDNYLEQLVLDLDDVATTQGELEAEAINNTVQDFEPIKPAAAQLIVAYKAAPLSMKGRGQGLTLKPFLKDFSQTQIQRVNGLIAQGYLQGQTISEITKAVTGTRSKKYRDGELDTIRRNDRTMVRTAVQNAGEQARQRTWEANKDLIKGVKWVSTLDSRTTPQCQALDGEEFPIDKGPRPPIHYGCRSTVTPVLSERFDFLEKGGKRPAVGSDGAGQVRQGTTYYSWLKNQPKVFQDDILGKELGLLFRNGGLSSEEFSKLRLNTNFKPRTLAQMREEAPKAFKAANL